MKIFFVLSAGLLILYLSLQNWRRSVKAALVVVVFEGVLRKWILPQASDQILLLKDVVLLGAYIRYYFLAKRETLPGVRMTEIKMLIVLIIIWCGAEAMNPRLGSPIIGLWGMKAYFFYIPLMWMVPNLFKNETELMAFLRRYFLIVIPVGILGIIQFFSPPTSPLNVYAGGQIADAGFAGFENIRITGTFPYLSGYSTFLTISFALLIPLAWHQPTLLWQSAFLCEILLILITSFMTGARSLVIFEVIYLVGYVALLNIKHPKLTFKYLIYFLMPGAIAFLLLTKTSLSIGYNAFMYRVTSSDSVSERIVSEFINISWAYNYAQFDGYGTGATHQATEPLRQSLQLPTGDPPPPAEGEMGRVMLELGPIGMSLWYLLRASLLIYLILQYFYLKNTLAVQLNISLIILHITQLSNPLVFNHVFAVYYWFLCGFILLLPKWEQTSVASKRQHFFKQLKYAS